MALIKIKEKRQPKKASAASSPASPGNRLHVVENAPKIKLNKTQKKAAKKQPKQKPVRGHVRRFLENREPKIVENPKTAMLLRSTTASQYILNVLRDINRLMTPHSKLMTKKNELHPFDDQNSLEFLSKKNDCSLFALASDSKKRPNNIIMGRLFNYQLLDMVELGVTDYKSIESFKGVKSVVGHKPMFVFQGDLFEYNEDLQLVKNLFLDFFRGEQIDKISLQGLDKVIVVSADVPEGSDKAKIYFRVYYPELKKSGDHNPRIELHEQGPSIDFELRRKHVAPADLKKESLKIPRTIKPKKVKNVSHSSLGEKLGQVHMTKQDVNTMQTRKIKALKILRKEKKLAESKAK